MTAIRKIKPMTSLPAFGDALESAIVRSSGEDGLIVQRNGRGEPARVAMSCLVRPEPGDLVLLAETQQALWVIAVLESAAPRPLTIEAPGDLHIAADRGRLSLGADEVHIEATTRARLATADLTVEAKQGHTLIGSLVHAGREISAHVARLRHIGELAETLVGLVVTRARQSLRFIDGNDQLRSGDIDHRATGSMSLQADCTFLTGETVVKVDADQIHMG